MNADPDPQPCLLLLKKKRSTDNGKIQFFGCGQYRYLIIIKQIGISI